jgi:hypothetical protein
VECGWAGGWGGVEGLRVEGCWSRVSRRERSLEYNHRLGRFLKTFLGLAFKRLKYFGIV